MSKQIKFDTSSYFEQLNPSTFIILVRQSIWKSLFGLCISIIFMIAPWYSEDVQNNPNTIYICMIFSSIFVLFSLHSIFYYEKISVDTKGNALVKRKCFAGISYKIVSLEWPIDAYYINENVFDSYQRVTTVWLLAKSDKSKQSKRLVEFTSLEQYKGFIQILTEKFPELQIREWHD